MSNDVSYEVFRGGTPRFLVFLHGHGLNRTYFRPLCRRFAEIGQSYVAVDLPGYGYARDVPCGGFGDIAAYLSAIMDAERIGEIVPVGYSFGGFVSLAWCARAPERMRALVLMACSFEMGMRTMRPSLLWTRLPKSLVARALTRARPRDGQPDFDFSERAIRDSDFRMMQHTAMATSARSMRRNEGVLRGESLRAAVAGVRVPTLIVQPRRDDFFTRYSYDYLARTIPGATREIVECAHNIAPQWAAVFGLVRGFLSKLETA